VDVWIFCVYAIFLILSDKILVQYKVNSHIMELDQDVCGSSIPDGTAVQLVFSARNYFEKIFSVTTCITERTIKLVLG